MSYRTRNKITEFQETITAKYRKDTGTSAKDDSFDNPKFSLDNIKRSSSLQELEQLLKRKSVLLILLSVAHP